MPDDPVLLERLERLAAASIRILAVDVPRHFVLERDGFAALVERTEPAGFGRIGAPGLLTEKGLAMLVWRGTDAWFVAHDFEQAATSEQIAAIRRFSADLHSTLK